MPSRIEDYALIGDTQTCALVGRDGSIDWACLPRFDSSACFAALLGDRSNGHWSVSPAASARTVERRYREGTLVLETDLETADGAVRLIDFMPVRDGSPRLVRIVEGLRGRVDLRVDLVIRFDYGSVIPWVRRRDGAITATGGPDALCLRTDVEMRGEHLATVGGFSLVAGERRSFVLTWFPSHQDVPAPLSPIEALADTERWWREWSARGRYAGPWAEAVAVSSRVLKALTFGPTGGIVAAATTSLPERPRGVRNWDYRYCWLRDASLTLYALMLSGYMSEAEAWREWLLRAVAGDCARLQIMYGVAGERRLPERELPWLVGYESSLPVRIGNAAHEQTQLDIYGEVLATLYEARCFGIGPDPWAWSLERKLLEHLESRWRGPDEGIWEVRGGHQHFTSSKIMAWMAFDRAIKSVRGFGLKGPVERWRAIRDEIHAEVCVRGYDAGRNTFTQAYGRPQLDASTLLVSLSGFLPAADPRVQGTVAAIERDLVEGGLVLRYRTDRARAPDGLPPGDGAFLPCSFWLADVYMQMGRRADATRLFEQLLALRNDVGLLSEEYDPHAQRMLGNFPQAFSHVALVNTAHNLTAVPESPAFHRCRRD